MHARTVVAILLVGGVPATARAIDVPEIEPNDSKAQALTNGAATLASGDALVGTTTGTSTTTSGAASADTFLVKTALAPLGIYRHRLTISTAGAAGHTGTIRGLTSSSSGASATGDATMQTSAASPSGATPGRANQWYGFGRGEQIYYRVTGAATTTSPYRAEILSEIVQPVEINQTLDPGMTQIHHLLQTDAAYDRDMMLFDSSFNPIVGVDDPDTLPMSIDLAPGRYYLAYARWNLAAGTFAGAVAAPAIGGIQGTFQTGGVLDFDDAVATSGTGVSTVAVSISIAGPGGTVTAVGPALSGSYEVAWFAFTVAPAPSCPSCIADYDASGGVDPNDVTAFFADYEQGASCADVDQDGGISGADIGTFFAQFEAGGC